MVVVRLDGLGRMKMSRLGLRGLPEADLCQERATMVLRAMQTSWLGIVRWRHAERGCTMAVETEEALRFEARLPIRLSTRDPESPFPNFTSFIFLLFMSSL